MKPSIMIRPTVGVHKMRTKRYKYFTYVLSADNLKSSHETLTVLFSLAYTSV